MTCTMWEMVQRVTLHVSRTAVHAEVGAGKVVVAVAKTCGNDPKLRIGTCMLRGCERRIFFILHTNSQFHEALRVWLVCGFTRVLMH